MYDNPYPAKYLPEPAWNQLVLKAFFTEKDINRIGGVDERANPELANILSDYAHERWAAHRPVHPQLWRFVGKFMNEIFFNDIKKVLSSENKTEQSAAALAAHDASYPPAKNILNENRELDEAIKSGRLTWNSLQ